MEQNDKIQLFEDKRIRTAWDEEKEEWYFSIVDVCEVLSGTDNPRRYWSDLKRKLKSEGAVELYEKIVQLKMTAPDGKKRLTDVADTEQLLRIVQSIPSPKAEPFRAWLAQVEHHPCFELFYRNTGGFLYGKPCVTRLSTFLAYVPIYHETPKLRRCFYTPASRYEHDFSIYLQKRKWAV